MAFALSVSHIVEVAGYPLLFLIVMGESSGVPIPGETALAAGGIAASRGILQIEWVIVVAAAGAIVGDNIGYLIGKHGGRRLLERPGRWYEERQATLRRGEPFFERHGPKAVFLGRFIVVLRIWASWLAGATEMRWRSFFLWNALGGICWATGVGLAAYYVGNAAIKIIEDAGYAALAIVVIAIVAVFVWHRRSRRGGDARGEKTEKV
ncbi:MAG TPA: DedA family protein [Solirubrobacteraceae bacterium]|nr:DedA family protein [Solirubrobacteraceae bacterium]